MRNVHIYMNEFTNASRVLKQVNSLINHKVFDTIDIVALWSEELPEYEAISDNISIHRIKLLTRPLPKNLFFQSIKYLEFCTKTICLTSKIRPNIINAHSLAVLPISFMAKTIFKSALVYDTHELESERNSLNGIRKKISKIFEKKLIKKVDMILVVSESIADWYVTNYKINRPTVVLNAPEYRRLKDNDYFREELGIREDQVILLYQGALLNGRGVQLILNAFKQRSNNKTVVVFMGYGLLQDDIQKAAKTYDNIYFFPAVSPDVVLEYTASADIGIHLIQNTCLNHNYCMPNKLFQYAMAGLPVLVSNMKDMSKLVKQYNMGAVIDDFSEKDINTAIDNLMTQNLSVLKSNAYQAACDHAWEVQESKMIESYNKELYINIRK